MVAALTAFAAAPCPAATTAGEVYAGNAELIANTNCVVLGDYCFSVGRAVSRNGGDGVGFVLIDAAPEGAEGDGRDVFVH